MLDDRDAVVDNVTIRSLGDSLRGGPAQSPTAGRPLANLTFALNYAWGGASPAGYHVVNLGLHLACALLVFGVVRRVLETPRAAQWTAGSAESIAGLTALLWVVHPLNSEIVNYATQRTEALMALAFLGTLYCGLRALTTERSGLWLAGSVASSAAGMLCKESMAIAPVMMLLLDATFVSGGVRVALRRRPGYYGALALTLLVLAALLAGGPRWRSAGFASGVSPWVYLLNQAQLIVRYLRLVFVPVGLVLDYGQPLPYTIAAVWPQATLVAALLAATVALWFIAPPLAFFATWVFVTLAPSSSFVPIATEVGAERRMYLPLVGVLVLLATGVSYGLVRLSSTQARRSAGIALASITCIVLMALTAQRNREYQSVLGLWQTVVARYPHGRAHYNLGIQLKQEGRRAEAIDEYRLAAATEPGAHYALGFEWDADGRRETAIEEYQTFIRLAPADANVPRTYHQIGRALMALGRHQEAVAAFRNALARKTGDPDSLAGLGDASLALEHWNDAVAAYTEFLRVKPEDVEARFNMGLALVHLDRDAEARDCFAEVVRRRPTDIPGHVNLAYALANTGRLNDAVLEFRRALELEKDPAGRNEIQAALSELLGAH